MSVMQFDREEMATIVWKYVEKLCNLVVDIEPILDFYTVSILFKYAKNFDGFIQELIEDENDWIDPVRFDFFNEKLTLFKENFDEYRKLYLQLFS